MPPVSPVLSDQQVVAAINACIDFKKLQEIDSPHLERFKCLMKHRRIGAVCFFRDLGFGLKLHNDKDIVAFADNGADEAVNPMGREAGEWHLDLEGYWLRCPAGVAAKKEEWIIMDAYAIMFLNDYEVDEDYDEYDEDDEDEETIDVYTDPNWVSLRSRAKVFESKVEANKIANSPAIKGVVVKKS